MDYRSANDHPEKSDRAALLLVALAALLVRGHERVALLGKGAPPSTGRATLIRLAAEMDLGTGPPLIHQALPRHGALVLIGDFLTPLEDLTRVIAAYAAAGVRGHLLQVLDPAEEALPFSGRVLFKGMEDDGQALFGRVENVREEYQKAMLAHRDGLRGLAATVGWTYALHHTDRPPETALLALYLALAGPGTGG